MAESKTFKQNIAAVNKNRSVAEVVDGLAIQTRPTMNTTYMMPRFVLPQNKHVTTTTPSSTANASDTCVNHGGTMQLQLIDIGNGRRRVTQMIEQIRFTNRVAMDVLGSALPEGDLSHVLDVLCNIDSELNRQDEVMPDLLTIELNLVLNLSSIILTEPQTSLLMKGVQFGLVGYEPRASTTAKATNAVNDFLSRLADRLALSVVCESSVPVHRPFDDSGAQTSLSTNCRKAFLRKVKGVRKESLADNSFDQMRLLKFARNELTRAVSCSHSTHVKNITEQESEGFKELRHLVRAGKITIRKADKSRQFVVMDTHAYNKGVMNLLSDVRNYIEVPFNGKYKAAALLIRAIKDFGSFLPKFLQELLLSNTKEPRSRRFYALPKTHKERCKWLEGTPPMRPICPDVGTESTVSGKFVAAYLQPFVERGSTFFKNSYELVSILKDIRDIPESAVFLAGDVDSLYPNVPPADALEVVENLFDSHEGAELPTNMKKLIIEILRAQMFNNYFEFDGKSFLQVRGVPMGKPWAPAVANIYMNKWDTLVRARLQRGPRLFVRYVDDVLFIFDTVEEAQRALQVMQGLWPNIRIGEYCLAKQCHFLDLALSLVSAETAGCFVSFSVYRKPSDLRVLLDFTSSHSLGVKLSTLFSQCVRIWKLCDSWQTAMTEIRVLIVAMIRFRHLSLELANRTWRRFRWWVVARIICNRMKATTVTKRHQGVRRTPCVLPIHLHTNQVRKALHAVSSRLSYAELKWTGQLTIMQQSGTQLNRLLF